MVEIPFLHKPKYIITKNRAMQDIFEKPSKVLLDFLQKIAESRGRASGRAPQSAKLPSVATDEILNPRTAKKRSPQRARVLPLVLSKSGRRSEQESYSRTAKKHAPLRRGETTRHSASPPRSNVNNLRDG